MDRDEFLDQSARIVMDLQLEEETVSSFDEELTGKAKKPVLKWRVQISRKYHCPVMFLVDTGRDDDY